MQSALSNLSDALNTLIATGNSSSGPYAPANSTSWSIGMFSTSDSSSDPFWQYHYTAPTVANSTAGVHQVDIDSIYRLGSITKLITVYSLLVAAGDGYWQEPVTKYVPELAEIAQGDPAEGIEDITRIRWQDITVGDLANHLSGLPRDYSADLYIQLAAAKIPPTSIGFPTLNASQIPECSLATICNRTEFFQFYAKERPAFLPATTPAYSNEAYQILGYVIEGITNETVDQIAQESIYSPLDLTQSSFSVAPNASLGAIPIGLNDSGWTLYLADGSPAGSMYSSLRDVNKIGRSMLNSTLLSPAVTRRWLKPGSHTDSLRASVGKPWEIYRSEVNGRVVDAYTKSGNIGYWGSILVLIPDYQVGFSILGAAGPDPLTNPNGGVLPSVVADIVASNVLPALDQLAKQQAVSKYAGTYKASASSGINSTATLVADDLPGLSIARWISNGTDLLGSMGSARAYPTDLRSSTGANGTNQIAFNVQTASFAPETSTGFFNPDCETWFGVASLEYGDAPLEQIIFTLDASGKVLSAEIPALRLQMDKVQ